MTFAVVTARTTTSDAASTSSRAINLGGPSAGELLVVFATTQSAGGPYTIDTSLSGDGWYLVQGPGTVNGWMAVMAKVATGGDALTLRTLASVRLVAVCYRITGHGSALTVGSFATAITSNGNPPNVAISGAAQDLLLITALGTSGSAASSAPAGYSSLTTAAISSVVAISSAERELNGTSDDPGAFTSSLSEWTATTVAIHEFAVTTAARLTQAAAEVLSNVTPAARLTQINAEVVSQVTAAARLTQIAVEVVSANVPIDSGAGPGMLLIAT